MADRDELLEFCAAHGACDVPKTRQMIRDFWDLYQARGREPPAKLIELKDLAAHNEPIERAPEPGKLNKLYIRLKPIPHNMRSRLR